MNLAMMRSRMVRTFAGLAIVGVAYTVSAAAPPTAVIEKPRPRTVTTGSCRILGDGTFSGTWGPADLPTLAFTIGPGAAMADQMHANKAKFAGPGKYQNEILAVYLGKTALEDSYGGLGTVIVNPDGHSGTFTTNDGKTSGRFDCGAAPR